MKKKPKSKRKSQHRRPPLSILDKTIYALACLLFFSAIIVSSFLFEDIRDRIAFRDPTVTAYAEHSSYLLILPLLLCVMLCIGIPLYAAWEKKAAIFGNPKVQYGKDPWDKNYFPLLDRRRRAIPATKSDQKLRRGIFSFCCIALLLCFLPALFSFYGRDCLHEDNIIVSHNAVNRVSATYHAEDFAHLTLRTRLAGSRSNYRTYEMVIKMHDGRTFVFSDRDFGEKGEAHKELSLAKMLEVKALFSPDAITYKGAEKVDKIAEDRGLNESQIRQLHQLFGN